MVHGAQVEGGYTSEYVRMLDLVNFVYKNRQTTNIILIKVYSKVYSGPHQPETFIIIIIII